MNESDTRALDRALLRAAAPGWLAGAGLNQDCAVVMRRVGALLAKQRDEWAEGRRYITMSPE